MSFSSDNPQLANQLPISIDFSKDPKEFYNQLTLLYKRIASSVNSRDLGFYFPQETSSGQEYFDSTNPQGRRSVYRKVVDFGVLPAAGTKTVAHGIAFTSLFYITRLYAASTDNVNLLYIAIPYASPILADNIELSLDATNVIITVGKDRSAFTTTYVVIEYTKE